MSKSDAVLIGAGHDSLACAASRQARLAPRRFERNAVCGGAVRTEEDTLPSIRHDLGAG